MIIVESAKNDERSPCDPRVIFDDFRKFMIQSILIDADQSFEENKGSNTGETGSVFNLRRWFAIVVRGTAGMNEVVIAVILIAEHRGAAHEVVRSPARLKPRAAVVVRLARMIGVLVHSRTGRTKQQ